MNRSEDFRIVIAEWFLQELPFTTFGRDISIPLKVNPLVAIAGPRRSGKTFLMYSMIKRLREKLNPQNILYVNFEHERLGNLDTNDLSDMITIYYETAKIDQNADIYLFLDEIQAVNGWSKWVMMCSLYSIDSYKRENILLEGYKGESRVR